MAMDADIQGKGEEDTCGLHTITNALSLAVGNDKGQCGNIFSIYTTTSAMLL